ncbi:transglutaminase domain-containing protein [Candidatus Binatus sp.]|uniref:transglutaminase domain-containing protein n=1 Tax=Candidatus Binatus sp. TaxID=2811406 RepID=UPI003CC23ED5
MQSPQEYYRHDGPMTALGAHAEEIRELPKDVAGLCEVVQGVLIHRDIAPWLYGITLTEAQRDDGHLRPIGQMLTRIHEIDSRPITKARDVGHRLPSVCRHFSLMLCSILRAQGVPTRPRCGFGAYFTPGKFEDHWVCEYWNAREKRWVLVDAQLDAIQRKALNITFNPLDVPHDRFIIAGDAWQRCRNGGADSNKFGLTHANLKGLWFVAGNVIRDLASLNRMEMLPWDVWGMMDMNDDALTDEKKTLIDRVAALTLAGDDKFAEVRAIYESDERLRVPPVVFNALRNAPEPIAAS